MATRTKTKPAPTFDRALSLRIDAILHGLDTVDGWPDGKLKTAARNVLLKRLQELEREVPA